MTDEQQVQYVPVGWYHKNVKHGEVHQHADRIAFPAYHRECEQVYVERPAR